MKTTKKEQLILDKHLAVLKDAGVSIRSVIRPEDDSDKNLIFVISGLAANKSNHHVFVYSYATKQDIADIGKFARKFKR